MPLITVGPRTAFLMVTLLGKCKPEIDAAVDQVADLLSRGQVVAARQLAYDAGRRAVFPPSPERQRPRS